MSKASEAGRALQKLTLILAVAATAILCIPVVRLMDAIKTSEDLDIQSRQVAEVHQIRAQVRAIGAAIFEGSRTPEVDVSPRLKAAIRSLNDAYEKATKDGVRFVSPQFAPALKTIEKEGKLTLQTPQSQWATERGKPTIDASSQMGTLMDDQIARLLETSSSGARERKDRQYAFLAAAFLATAGLSVFFFLPTLKAVREAFQDLDRRREEEGKKAAERGHILSATTYAVLVCDAQGLVRSANPAAGHVFRAEAEQIVGKRLASLLGERGPLLVTAAREGRTVETELRTRRLDGEEAPVAVSLTPMEGDVFLAIVRDLSDREEVQRRLAEEQARSRSLLESIPDVMVRLDEAGIVTEYRPVPGLSIASRPEALKGRPFESALPPAAAAAYRKAWSDAISGVASAFEFAATLAGRDRYLEARLAPMHDGGALVLLRDMTERDEAIAGLQRSEQVLVASQRAAGLGSWDVDLATGRISFSEGLRELLDLRPGDPESVQAILDRTVPDDRETMRRALVATEEEGEAYDLTIRFALPNGKGFDGRCLGGPRGERLLNVVQDVTEGLRQQAQLVEARESAERGARAKSEFLANMSHEIRTPMNGIIGVVYLLQESDLTPRQRMYADTIQKSGENLLLLINDVLDLSKIESGKMTLERKEFSLHEMVRDIADVFGPGAREKGIAFECLIDASLPERVIGDSVRVRQIIVNLAGNAVKFTNEGSVTLSLRAVERHHRGAMVEIRITDTGIGIPAHRLGSIFESFVQADGTTTRRFGGSGLGLAISRQLIDLMGGRMDVRSREGVGSEFTVTLELTVPIGEAAASLPPIPAPGLPTDVRILLAEDNPVNQMVVRDLLQSRGCEVMTVGDGAQAVDAALTREFDIILMDVQMPRMDGYEATRRLRELGVSTPVIAMTANALEGDRERCLESGMDDYLPKPVRPPDLLAAIARWSEPTPTSLPIPKMDRKENASDLFDRSRLDEMFGEGDSMSRDILREWLRTSPELLARITGGDPKDARAAAHGLKGASRTIGADRLGFACEAFERAEHHEIPAVVGHVTDTFGLTVAAIEEHLGRAAA